MTAAVSRGQSRVSALGECDSVTLRLQRVATGAGRLRGPEGGHFWEAGWEVSRRVRGVRGGG